MIEQEMRDYSASRAVIMSTWDYKYLRPVPAVRNSHRTIVHLLTSELCGWPRDRLIEIVNERSAGDLADRLITAFEDVTDVALFYYTGHGQIDMDVQLCLGLVTSRAEHNRRAATSLAFQAVRRALLDSPAATKIVILDCCFAGLANLPINTLSSDEMVDKAAVAGAYTLAASGEYASAWFESDPSIELPHTYFTKYLAGVVEEGIPGEAQYLKLHTLFVRVREKLDRDGLPTPSERSVDSARDFLFAMNAAPPETHRDPEKEIRVLRRLLADIQTRTARESAEARLQEQNLRARTEELARLKDRAQHSQDLDGPEQVALQNRIVDATRRFHETNQLNSSLDIQYRLLRSPEDVLRSTRVRFEPKNTKAVIQFWRWRRISFYLTVISALLALSSFAYPSAQYGDQLRLAAYVFTGLAVLSFPLASWALSKAGGKWKLMISVSVSLAVAACLHRFAGSWWPAWIFVGFSLFIMAICWVIVFAESPAKFDTAVGLYITSEAMVFREGDKTFTGFGWSEIETIIEDDKAVWAKLRPPLRSYYPHRFALDTENSRIRLFGRSDYQDTDSILNAINLFLRAA